MKALVPEHALAAKFYDTFDILATGGIITDKAFSRIRGFCLFENNTDPVDPATTTTSNRRPTKLTYKPEFAERIERLGTGRGGVIELVVKSVQQFAICSRCRDYQGTVDAAMLQELRGLCLDVGSLCPACMIGGGIPGDIKEVVLPGGIHVMKI